MVVEVGGGLRELAHDGRPLVDGYGESEMCDSGRGQLLFPWPNRVDRGRYHFAGRDLQLPITEPGRDCANHGLTRWANWTADPRGESVQPGGSDQLMMRYRLHSQPGWPHVLDIQVGYRLDASGLTVTVAATNVGANPAPYGNGAHPYLNAGTDFIDACQLHVPADTRVTSDARGIPTGTEPVDAGTVDFRESRSLGTLAIDDAFTDLHRDDDGRAWTTLTGPDGHSVSLWCDTSYRWLQIFTGDHVARPDKRRTGLAVEPMTCPANAYVTGTGLISLEPGQTATGQWGIVSDR
jgi:aldose 1-epimerase